MAFYRLLSVTLCLAVIFSVTAGQDTSGSQPCVSDVNDCRRGNDRMICSGRGRCECGLCQCFARPNPAEIFVGTYCECDNFSCPRSSDGQICGGPSRGMCVCGACVCLPDSFAPNCSAEQKV